MYFHFPLTFASFSENHLGMSIRAFNCLTEFQKGRRKNIGNDRKLKNGNILENYPFISNYYL